MNVICELARKNPKNYLSLAPLFFKVCHALTTEPNAPVWFHCVVLPSLSPYLSLSCPQSGAPLSLVRSHSALLWQILTSSGNNWMLIKIVKLVTIG